MPDLATWDWELENTNHLFESLTITYIESLWQVKNVTVSFRRGFNITHTERTAYLEVFLQLLFFSEFLEVTTCLGLLSLLGKLSGKRGAGWRDREVDSWRDR